MQGQVHSYPSSWMQPCSPLSSTQASSQQEAQHKGAPSRPCWLLGTSILGGAVAGDIFSPWHRWVSCCQSSKRGLYFLTSWRSFSLSWWALASACLVSISSCCRVGKSFSWEKSSSQLGNTAIPLQPPPLRRLGKENSTEHWGND